MKCKQLIKEYGHLRRENLPPEVCQEIENDPAAQAWFTQSEIQRDLISLKRHEQPAPEVHGRVVYHVRTRIEAGERMAAPELAPPRTAIYYQLTTVAAIVVVGTITYINTQRAPSSPNYAIEGTPADVVHQEGAAAVAANSSEKPLTPIEEAFRPIATSTNQIALNTNGIYQLPPRIMRQPEILPVVGPGSR